MAQDTSTGTQPTAPKPNAGAAVIPPATAAKPGAGAVVIAPATAAKPSASDAPATAHKPLRWSVTLQLDDNGYPQPQGDWRKDMKVGDKVKFLSPNGEVKVEFVPITGQKDIKGNAVPDGTLPFGQEKKEIEIIGGVQEHEIVNSCQATMKCYIKAPDGRYIGYDQDKGTTVCTGGGTNPVTCH